MQILWTNMPLKDNTDNINKVNTTMKLNLIR